MRILGYTIAAAGSLLLCVCVLSGTLSLAGPIWLTWFGEPETFVSFETDIGGLGFAAVLGMSLCALGIVLAKRNGNEPSKS